jgi:hypothetical protein
MGERLQDNKVLHISYETYMKEQMHLHFALHTTFSLSKRAIALKIRASRKFKALLQKRRINSKYECTFQN